MARYYFTLLFVVIVVGIMAFHCESISDTTRSIPGAEDEVQAYSTGHTLRLSECPGSCTQRCSKASKHKPCMFYCNLCCSKCLCVPPGTYGNKQVCPCYNNMKNARGGPKCP
eukprot:c10618_g1_i1 orf=440-775(-)